MPYSSDVFDADIEAFLRTHDAQSYLDLGPGAGKYGRMIRRVNPDALIAAVECDDTYISYFELEGIYDVVARARIETAFDALPDLTADVVLIGDVIEHLKKSEGIDLLNYLIYRCHYCLVVAPQKYVQYSWRERAAEAHRSVWAPRDFEAFGAEVQVRSSTLLATLTGYLADPEAEFGYDFVRPEPLAGLV
ncbi:hypothetical protein ENSA5_37180 [Enhygromyxa salina]|uniref:Methyltransferase domain protein n=1 Tax=Enhygromyxa salina TaxID=215803 RepID=A0A2S9XSK9_9BACT|nr:hypothetical protein [Enhygromyxa salina]PRP95849.1 hypothetical protein ENSA5_37180 [Enhygromyxa salina]